MDLPVPPVLSPSDELEESGPPIDAVLERLRRGAASSPVLPEVSAEQLSRALPEKPPNEGTDYDSLLGEVESLIAPLGRRNAHPGFFGYICSSGLPSDPASHALAAALNQNVTGFSSAPSATMVERVVVRWMKDLLGLPTESDGYFVAGGSLANMTGLAAALHSCVGPDLRSKGLASLPTAAGLRIYTTHAAHFSVEKTVALLGLGTDCLRRVRAGADYRMDVADLEAKLSADRGTGLTPVAVVASAGSTTTGAIDPLQAASAVCRQHGVWLHVDAAYGGAAALCPELRARFQGIENADSLTFDFHKWLYSAIDASLVIVRRPDVLRRVFSTESDYAPGAGDGSPEEYTFYHQGVETTRRFRALPVYLALRRFGLRRLCANVLHNVQLAEYVAARVDATRDLELMTEPQLGIACFRYAPAGSSAPELDAWNREIRSALVEGGDFYLSETTVQGAVTLRVCIASHHTRASHLDDLLTRVVAIGEAAGEGRR